MNVQEPSTAADLAGPGSSPASHLPPGEAAWIRRRARIRYLLEAARRLRAAGVPGAARELVDQAVAVGAVAIAERLRGR